jgi:hypothetical protein
LVVRVTGVVVGRVLSLIGIAFASMGIFVLEGISIELPGIMRKVWVTTSGCGGKTERIGF